MPGSQAHAVQQDIAPYSFEFIAAPPDLAPYLNSLYIFTCEQERLEDVLPSYSGQLLCFLRGRARIRLDERREVESSDGFFLAPILKAAPFVIEGPALAIGASINFRGWAALTGLSVEDFHDDILPPGVGLPDALAKRLLAFAPAFRAGKKDVTALVDELAAIVREGLSELPQKHVTVIERTHEWLSSSFKPELADLHERLPYSERQIQRLVARFFGQPPVRLIRRYRAIRAATLFSLPQMPGELETEIREAFYDQAHMIKEIRMFTGRTPRRLQPKEGSVVTEMLGPGGYGSVDLFGGNEAEQLAD